MLVVFCSEKTKEKARSEGMHTQMIFMTGERMDEVCQGADSLAKFVHISQLTRLNRGESVLRGVLTLSLPESKGKG